MNTRSSTAADATSRTSSSRSVLGRAAMVGAWVLLPLVAFNVLYSCATPKPVAPYETPPALASDAPIMQLGLDNSGCMSCHERSSDPHGSTVLSCVQCHGGDGQATTIEAAHPKPRFPDRWESSANPEHPATLTLKESLEWIRFVNPGDLRVANQTCGPCHGQETLAVMKSVMTTASHFWGVATYANGILPTKRSILGESYDENGNPRVAQTLIWEPGNEGPDPRIETGGAKVGNKSWVAGSWRVPTDEEVALYSLSRVAAPLPRFEVTQPGNIYRIFEKGSRLGGAALGFNGLPAPIPGLPDKFEDPGRPNNRPSDRGPGTLNRVDLATLNVHKTRLNDPHLSMFGTNDQPGDYRSSGCTACHMIYANDRDAVHSGPYAQFGNQGHGNVGGIRLDGKDFVSDPTIPTDEPGHPIGHRFVKGIPSSQCMVCHMHQPNSFVNTFYGYQMWSYETDAEHMWPAEQEEKSMAEIHDIFTRNPEGAAQRGRWGDPDFLQRVAEDVNPKAKHTQFGDYHGHGWNFRAVFKTDREGNLLDQDGAIVPYDDPDKFDGVLPPLGQVPEGAEKDAIVASIEALFGTKPGKPVHLKDIHAERGMHCVDCHFAQDVHGDGHVYAEYQAAVQIRCQDCHGTVDAPATLQPSGPAAKNGHGGPDGVVKTTFLDEDYGELNDEIYREFTGGKAPGDGDVELNVTPFEDPDTGKKLARFYRKDGKIYQRSMLYEGLEWPVVQVHDTVREGHEDYNREAAWAKLQPLSDESPNKGWSDFAHDPKTMDCAACHTSWVTSCFGCHLPQQANWRSEVNHFEGETLRNYATYNPQVARDDVFMLGVSPHVKSERDPATDELLQGDDGKPLPKIAVVRSSSAVNISSQDAQRRIVYKQQSTVAANGLNGQCFNTHFAHTVRTTETRKCSDCHVVPDVPHNNAWLAQTFLLGTNYVNFFGMHAYVGTGADGFEAVEWTEWTEPQAVIGSEFHRIAFPDEYADFESGGRELDAEHHGGTEIQSLVHRGEYLFTASGAGGFRVYDVANVANKDFSEKLVTAPVSPLGQDTHVATRYATAVALPTNMSISMSREVRPDNQEQVYTYRGREQNLHEVYRYAYVTDREEGLVVVDVECLNDGDPQNNFIEKKLAWNPDRLLAGATNITIAGTTAYICCKRGLVVVDIADPLAPRMVAEIGAPDIDRPTSVAVQLRYAFVTDAEGLKVVDVTFPEKARVVPGAVVEIGDARDVYVARSYAYVAGGDEGMVIVDVRKPERPQRSVTYDADGRLRDLHEVKVGMVYDSVYALCAAGDNGFHVVSLVSPNDGGRSAYGFSPVPMPKWVAWRDTGGPALAVAKGLDRDRAVDESGNQVAVFGRIGGRPFTLAEMRQIMLNADGTLREITDTAPSSWTPPDPTTIGAGAGGGR